MRRGPLGSVMSKYTLSVVLQLLSTPRYNLRPKLKDSAQAQAVLVTHGSHAEGRASNRKFDRGHAANVLRAPCLALVSLGTLFQKQRHQLHSNRRRACRMSRAARSEAASKLPSPPPPGTLPVPSPPSLCECGCACPTAPRTLTVPCPPPHTRQLGPGFILPRLTPQPRSMWRSCGDLTSAEEHVEISWR